MGENLSERLTIPMTPKMREQVDKLADDLGVRAVDVGRLSLVFFIQNFDMMSGGLFAIKKQVEEETKEEAEWEAYKERYPERLAECKKIG